MSKRSITIFGGSGFLGRHIVRKLAKENTTIKVAVRRPELAGFLRPLGTVGQITLVRTDVCSSPDIDRALDGSNEVINLTGILYERGKQRFKTIHAETPGKIAAAAKKAGVQKLVHISAIGADCLSNSSYARSKGTGENALLKHFPAATILRPSVVFGPEDDFFNKFGALARILPGLPIFCTLKQWPKIHFEGLYFFPRIEAGTTLMQPVYVSDVAEAVVRVLGSHSEESLGKTYELGGPQVYSFRELMNLVLSQMQLKRLLIPVPYLAANILGRIGQLLPVPPITLDQARLLQIDNVVSTEALTLENLGISPVAAELILPTYMKRFCVSPSSSK